ncbi:hypothetical protein QE152_g25683 [Popillia japonica]|uniref:Uncharacterized protein n=1 Tax=Popillia japonica TaxID=7064 RepID=A0AAW1JZS1_POPJA
MMVTIKKGSSIILQDKAKIVEGGEIHSGFIHFLIPILAAAAGPVLANILNKVVDTIDDKRNGLGDESRIKGKSLTLETPNQLPIPLKKTLSQKDKVTIEKNIRALMNITNNEDSDFPLKKTLSQKDKVTIEKNIRALMNITNNEDSDCEDDIPLLCFDKVTIEKNIRALMNITNNEDSDCEDDIPLLCFDKSKQVENINPTEEIKKLLNIQDPRLFETKS